MIKIVCDADDCENESTPQFQTSFLPHEDQLNFRIIIGRVTRGVTSEGWLDAYVTVKNPSTGKLRTAYYDACSTKCAAKIQIQHKNKYKEDF